MRSGLRVALPPTLPLTWSRREQNAKSAGASGVRTWVEGTGRGRGRVSGRVRARDTGRVGVKSHT